MQALIFNFAIANLDIFYFISLRDMPFSIMARKRCNPAQNTTLVVWLSQKLRCWVGQRILTQTKIVFNIGIFLFFNPNAVAGIVLNKIFYHYASSLKI